MKRAGHRAAEFETRLGADGSIAVPQSVQEDLGLSPSVRISVRLAARDTAALLKGRDVTNEELERIASLQLESTDQVIRFLLSGGSLKSRRRQLKLT